MTRSGSGFFTSIGHHQPSNLVPALVHEIHGIPASSDALIFL